MTHTLFCRGMVTILLLLGMIASGVRPAAADQSDRSEASSVDRAEATQLPGPGGQPARAQGRTWLYKLHGGRYSTGGYGFLGGGAVVPVKPRWSFSPGGEWLFVSDLDRVFMLNADLHYDIAPQGSMQPWVGGGIGIRHFAKGDGWPPEHSLGLNLLGGLTFGSRESGASPLVQGRVFLAGDTLFANDVEVVLSAGIQF